MADSTTLKFGDFDVLLTPHKFVCPKSECEFFVASSDIQTVMDAKDDHEQEHLDKEN